MKKGQIVEGMIEKIEFPNKGIVTVEDRDANGNSLGMKRVIVKNGIVGQKVSCSINKLRKGKAEGRLLAVLEKSPIEVESKCPHFTGCGGCTYQNLPYEEQLALKESQVKALLDQVYVNREENPDTSYVFESIHPSPAQYEYRNKMEFSFGDAYKDGPLALGMHKRGSFYDIVTVPECQIIDADYRLILTTVLDYCRERNLSFYHKLRHEGFLRHLLVRKAYKTGEILVALITSTQEQEDFMPLVERLLALQDGETGEQKAVTRGIEESKLTDKECNESGTTGKLSGRIAGILHTKNDSLADVVQSDETDILYGQDYFYEELLGMRFKISQFSFFQTNSRGAEVLYETARSYVGDLNADGRKDKIIFDLYSGTGTIAQMLAPVAKKVVGVEIVTEAVDAARENAKLNGLDNCEFIAGDVLKVLDTVTDKPDFIVLDPPRDGIHPKALTKIIGYGVDRIVYISCKPTSLARDLGVFLENGYRVEKVTTVDMFPGTVHVETIVLLQRENS
ncbi:MAG: 23S rRNA (uracil(1939)-C(5))-methyltransferase RlmD [Lachnospiraceae bacterium]|nr:23S rRNA (uracil(1939)-C(5))-methyltransferase RlmD [Lachnospiraceae bacterium]